MGKESWEQNSSGSAGKRKFSDFFDEEIQSESESESESENESENESDDDVTYIQTKHLTTEYAFHLQEWEKSLASAEDYAKKGDIFHSNTFLEHAMEHASQAGISEEEIQSRVQQVYCSKGDEKKFHVNKVEENIHIAKEYAKIADRYHTMVYLRVAKQHAIKAGILQDPEKKVLATFRQILASVGDEKGFHLKEMYQNLQWAEESASKGDRYTAELNLGTAKSHAKKAGAYDRNVKAKIGKIYLSIGDERRFNIYHVEQNLSQAEEFVSFGDRQSTEISLELAKYHAIQLGECNDAFSRRCNKILKSLIPGRKVKIEKEVRNNMDKNPVESHKSEQAPKKKLSCRPNSRPNENVADNEIPPDSENRAKLRCESIVDSCSDEAETKTLQETNNTEPKKKHFPEKEKGEKIDSFFQANNVTSRMNPFEFSNGK